MINTAALKQLSEFLRTLPNEKFDIMSYIQKDGRREWDHWLPTVKDELNECGTVACALGWLPAAMNYNDEVMSHFSSDSVPRNYNSLCERYLGFDTDCLLFDYLFSEYWGEYQPTAVEAADRIDSVLALKHDELEALAIDTMIDFDDFLENNDSDHLTILLQFDD